MEDQQQLNAALNSKSRESCNEDLSSRSNTKLLKATRGDKSSERVGLTNRFASTLGWLDRANDREFEPIQKKLEDYELKASKHMITSQNTHQQANMMDTITSSHDENA